MAFDIMAFLGGVNDYNTGGRSGNSIGRLFGSPNRMENLDRWSLSQKEDQERLRSGIDRLASELPPLGSEQDDYPEILVQNRAPAGGAVPDENLMAGPPPLGNRDWIEEVQSARDNAPNRKGMFGMKGTLRDVVGILGDAFLVQGGGNAIYQPQRKMERASDAVVGMTAGMDRNDPEMAAQLNAAERLLYEDPAAGMELLKNIEAAQLNQAVKQNQIAQRTEATQKTRLGNTNTARSQLQRILNNTDPAMRAQAIARYAPLLARQAGVEVEDLGVYPGMTPQEIEAFAQSDMNVFQSEQLPLRERSVSAQEKNAQSNAIRAARPPAGRAPSRESVTNVDAEVARKVLQGNATPQEKQYYEERLKRGGKTNRFSGGAGAPAVRPNLRVRAVRPANQ